MWLIATATLPSREEEGIWSGKLPVVAVACCFWWWLVVLVVHLESHQLLVGWLWQVTMHTTHKS